MSTTFKLSGAGFDRKSWDGVLVKLLRGESGWVPLQCMGQLYPEAATEPFKKGGILLLGKGSSRGVSVKVTEKKEICVELMSFASDVDWDVARFLLAAGHKLGAEVTGGEGKSLGAEELKFEAFQARSQEVLRRELDFTLGHVILGTSAIDSGGKCRLPVGHFELTLTKTDLTTLNINWIMDLLTRQCYLYGNAHVARKIQSQAPDGTHTIQAHYSGISTLVPEDIQGMTFSGPDGYYTTDAVPLERVKQILAEFVTPAGYHYLHFAPIPWDKQPALIEAITGKSTKEIMESLDQQFWESIVRLPVLTFVITAHADGEADKKEVEAFINYLKGGAADQNDQTIFAKACRRLQQEMKEVHAEIKELDLLAEFQLAIGKLDHRASKETAAAFKNRLYELAEKVAKASGGGLLGMGTRISEAEQQALDWIKKTLFPAEEK